MDMILPMTMTMMITMTMTTMTINSIKNRRQTEMNEVHGRCELAARRSV